MDIIYGHSYHSDHHSHHNVDHRAIIAIADSRFMYEEIQEEGQYYVPSGLKTFFALKTIFQKCRGM